MESPEIGYRETECKPTGFFLGLDLGQAQDHSALVVNERLEGRLVTMKRKSWQPEPVESGWRQLVKHRVRFVHRYKLGFPYPEIVASVGSIMRQLPQMRDRSELWIDATGVGRAVFDIFVAAALQPVGVTITAGLAPNRPSRDDIRIPKRELASLIQAALQGERIQIAQELQHARLLQDELANFRVRISAGGSETFEGRSGIHDDLVLALATAVWAAEKRDAVPGGALLQLAAAEMEAFHKGNGGRPELAKREYQPGSLEYEAEMKAKADVLR